MPKNLTALIVSLILFTGFTGVAHAASASVSIITKDGERYTGTLLDQGSEFLRMKLKNGTEIAVPNSQISQFDLAGNYLWNGPVNSFGVTTNTAGNVNVVLGAQSKLFGARIEVNAIGPHDMQLSSCLNLSKTLRASQTLGIGIALDRTAMSGYIPVTYTINFLDIFVEAGFGAGVDSPGRGIFAIGLVHEFN